MSNYTLPPTLTLMKNHHPFHHFTHRILLVGSYLGNIKRERRVEESEGRDIIREFHRKIN